MNKIKIALCQINPTVGDLEGNAKKILDFYLRAKGLYAPDIVVFPEMSLTGYPPEDLLLRDSFISGNMEALKRLARELDGPAAIVGYAQKTGLHIYNSAAFIRHSRISGIYSKQFLPNYGVFDEKRYFVSGKASGIITVKGVKIGLSICEDIWFREEEKFMGKKSMFAPSPCIMQARKGAEILINISASPFHAGKLDARLRTFRDMQKAVKCPLVYVNTVGGQDELVFDGRSLVLDHLGKTVIVARSFGEDIKCAEFSVNDGKTKCRSFPAACKEQVPAGAAEIHDALVLGTRDYVEKNGFKSVVVGLSGGIDSALTAAIAVEALGNERVLGVTMPSRYSTRATYSDAQKVAKNLEIKCLSIPIEGVFREFTKTLEPFFQGTGTGTTEENLQPRIRGVILMALSNKFGHLVLTTGNKSEVSVGYCTLYGDTAGGFAVLKDVPKTVVYELARYINKKSGKDLIPRTTITRAPTAELKPNQKDRDTLPPYDLLDDIISGYIEEDKGFKELLRKKYPKETLARIIKMIDLNEYKRRQSPPGIKITPKSFGRDRRMPITNRFRES